MNLIRITTVTAAVCLGAPVANAQFQPPQAPLAPARPTFSPYLNLLRNDASPALNYYGLVRPEQRALRAQAAFGQALQQTNQAIEEGIKGADPSLPATGHAATFNNTMGYFSGGGGGGGGRGFTRPMVFGGNRPQVFGSQRPQPFQGGGGMLRR